MKISVVISAYNEVKNVGILSKEIDLVMKNIKLDYELIFVDDGSTDGSYKKLVELKKNNKKIKIIKFRRNYGQTAGWQAGIDYSKGEIIIIMDGDLQNDPKDIPKLLLKLKKGYDIVSGWRYKRKDTLFKKIFSLISRNIRKIVIKDKIHDSGCSLKAYKRDVFKEIRLYGEMHRYIAELGQLKGFKVGEVKVNHRARKYGKTKYGPKRIIKGFLDLLFIRFMRDYSTRPLHLFGTIGIIQFLLSGFIFVEQIIKAILIKRLDLGPLLMLAVLFIITGTIFLIFGFISEILIRTYYNNNERQYSIEKFVK